TTSAGLGNIGTSSATSTVNSSPSMFATLPLTLPTPSFVLDHAYDDDLFIMDDVHAVNSTYDDASIRINLGHCPFGHNSDHE
ncbi:4063_t:CDS:1, partial [Paraglomus occultum]